MMKTFFLTVVALFGVCVMHAVDPFKGTLAYNISGPQARGLKSLSLVGDGKLLRVNILMGANNIAVIRDPETKMLTLLLPDQKVARTVSETSKMGNVGIGGEEAGEPKRTVSTEIVNILGYNTHLETIVFPSGNKVEAWVSDELGYFSIPEAFAGSMSTWVNEKAVPLRVIKWQDGVETVRLEATAATTDMPAPELFVVPADYITPPMPGK